MTARARTTLSLACTAVAAALTLTACGGEKKEPKADEPAAAQTKLAPVPKVAPAQVKSLVGRWVGTGKDYFQFKADGTGVWMKEKQSLWSGQAIPEGNNKFRFSWQGGDPKTATYWGVTVTDGGTKLLFAGTNQSYTKVRE